jgi:hypothetical protein
MGMNSRLPVDQTNIAAESGYFDLVANLNLSIRFLFAIKPAQQRMLESAYRREMAGRKFIGFGELG